MSRAKVTAVSRRLDIQVRAYRERVRSGRLDHDQRVSAEPWLFGYKLAASDSPRKPIVIEWETDYLPYGTRQVYNNFLDNFFLFTGDQFDYELGYNYAVAREQDGTFVDNLDGHGCEVVDEAAA